MRHYAMEPHEHRRKLESSGDFERAPLCGNGDAHAAMTRTIDHVDCTPCQSELAAMPSYLDAFGTPPSTSVPDWEMMGEVFDASGDFRYAVWHHAQNGEDVWQLTFGDIPTGSGGYGRLESLLALKGFKLTDVTFTPQSEREELRLTIAEFISEHLSHVFYVVPQSLLGIEDGGFASIHDTTSKNPYGSAFGNAVGGAMLRAINHIIGPEHFNARTKAILGGENVLIPIPAHPVEGEPNDDTFVMIGQKTTELVVEHLHEIFPSLPENSLDRFLPEVARFAREYAIANHRFEATEAPRP